MIDISKMQVIAGSFIVMNAQFCDTNKTFKTKAKSHQPTVSNSHRSQLTVYLFDGTQNSGVSVADSQRAVK